LCPSSGEYERFTAAILNAAIAPVVGRYTARLAGGIGPGTLRLLRQNLGILPPAEAQRFPARALFSGPAGGVLATAQTLAAAGLPQGAAFDSGGTSADVCLVSDGAAVHDDGSIAYIDQGGALRVGPQSAGADPGPACYGRSDEPTVTDAHVALGHLGADTLLGGGFPIDVDAAVRAVERLGRRIGLSAAKAARGILAIADATMARAVLAITAERAVDPAHVPLVAYGGAGGLHAAGLVRQAGMPFALVPPLPGAFSALGLALAGEAIEATAACRFVVDGRSLPRLLQQARELAAAAVGQLGCRGRVRVTAHARYAGQGAALRLPCSPRLAADFAREHARRYGFALAQPVEIVRLTARAETPPRRLPAAVQAASAPARAAGRRRPPVGGAAIKVVARAELRTAQRGPLVVEEATATTLAPAGWTVAVVGGALRLAPG
ncbi:MAG: hydantoinase/oxoprolinase family protein, partial [Planctomycetota bacterium]